MAVTSKIEWTDASWNPTTGCTKVSAGCDLCYAERLSERFRGSPGHPYEKGFDLQLRPERLDWPVKWRKPRKIFVNSMSDLFHRDIPLAYIDRVFDIMEKADQHTYQILTKRPRLMVDFWNKRYPYLSTIPSNIWIGVSIENRKTMNRLRILSRALAPVRFVSFEPLLGPIGDIDLENIEWVIVGGETGSSARPMAMDWAREIRDQCIEFSVPFFFKQRGGKKLGRLLDGREWNEFPFRPSQRDSAG